MAGPNTRPKLPVRLLLIEDDDVLGDALREYLRAEGHVVDWCLTLDQAQGLSSEPFDAWLIDWQLPDGSGLAWLQRQRQLGSSTPALILTARDRVTDRVQGLDAGADDYLVKPFAPEELAARLRVVGRRSRGGTGSVHQLAGVDIDMDARTAHVSGQRVELTGREWTVLEALLLRAGRIVPKGDLERLMTGFDAELASNAVEVHVSALRRKLGRDVIETIRGLGYRVEKSS
jgi:two-component system, OmpR family, response regulator